MVPEFRNAFNRRFEPGNYVALLADIDRQAGTHVGFRVAETPCFFARELMDEIVEAGIELTSQLLADPAYLSASLNAIPDAYRLPSASPHPHFMTADFGLVRLPDGRYAPRLVELQAFPSVFGFQALLGHAYRRHYQMDPSLPYFLGGHTEESFWELLRQVVVGEHPPEEVVLAEVHPEQQKTLPDFLLTAKRLGISVVDATQLIASHSGGRTRLHYRKDGRLLPVRRIYNRVIVDELIQKGITLPFDYRDDLDVKWAGHPNWYFQISKFSIPYLRHPTVPEAVFLDEWWRGAGSDVLHGDRDRVLLKPLFSFAGKGIVFAPTDEELMAIPANRQHEYILQKKMDFAPVIETPFGLTQAEIRILYLWPDTPRPDTRRPDTPRPDTPRPVTRPDGLDPDTPRAEAKMEPVLSLVRLGRGKMMGVDHNRDQQWVGASAAYLV